MATATSHKFFVGGVQSQNTNARNWRIVCSSRLNILFFMIFRYIFLLYRNSMLVFMHPIYLLISVPMIRTWPWNLIIFVVRLHKRRSIGAVLENNTWLSITSDINMYPYVNIDYVWIYVWTALEQQVCYRKYLLGLLRSLWNRHLRGCHCELLSHYMIITISFWKKNGEYAISDCHFIYLLLEVSRHVRVQKCWQLIRSVSVRCKDLAYVTKGLYQCILLMCGIKIESFSKCILNVIHPSMCRSICLQYMRYVLKYQGGLITRVMIQTIRTMYI